MSQEAQFPSAEPGVIRVVDPRESAGWDQAVGALPGAGIFHGSAWAHVLSDSYDYRPLFLSEFAGPTLRALLPLIEVNSWLTGRRGVSLPFADAVEPLSPDAETFQKLQAAAFSLGRERRWRYAEFRGGRSHLSNATPSTAFWRHDLALHGGEAALFAGFDEATRRAVRKAERAGVEVRFSTEESAMATFYRLHCQTRRRHGVPPQPYRFFEAIHRRIISAGFGIVALAWVENAAVAGAVFFHHAGKALFKFGAADEARQNLRPSNLVIWRAIQRFAKSGCARLDFGRTSLGQEGLRRFKRGWGGIEQTLDYARYDFGSGSYVTKSDDSSGRHTYFFRALPQPLLQLAGRCLYPHLG